MAFRILSESYVVLKQAFPSQFDQGQVRALSKSPLIDRVFHSFANTSSYGENGSAQSLTRNGNKVFIINELNDLLEIDLRSCDQRMSSSFSRGIDGKPSARTALEFLAPDSLLPWILPDRIPHTEPEDASSPVSI
ncbi:MAG: hypothetical protein V4492_07700 [Chlamydiota bacterium]